VGRYRLAKVYYEQRDYQAAAEELRQVLDDKSCPIQEAFHLAGLVDLRRDDRPAAERHFRRCIALAPKSCLARECQLASGGEP
jgi:Tfp pilus assembly protein PilF